MEYSIHKEIIHKKQLDQHILDNRIVNAEEWICKFGGSIYHYTSPDGLMGIINSRTVYFTDCQFLNDYMERMNINNDLDFFWKRNSNLFEADFTAFLKDIRIDNYEDAKGEYWIGNRSYKAMTSPVRYFVFSTSIRGDSLNLWKYYAKDNNYNGYAIGMLPYVLSSGWTKLSGSEFDKIDIMSGMVVYNALQKEKIILSAVNELYRVWREYEKSDLLDGHIHNCLKSWLGVISLFFKDNAFSSEEEYRYIAAVSVDALNDLTYMDYCGNTQKMYNFRLVNGVLAPYIKMPCYFKEVPEHWAVDSITIAPSLNAKQKQLGLEMFLGLIDSELNKCSIEASNIPLRY